MEEIALHPELHPSYLDEEKGRVRVRRAVVGAPPNTRIGATATSPIRATATLRTISHSAVQNSFSLNPNLRSFRFNQPMAVTAPNAAKKPNLFHNSARSFVSVSA